MSIRVAAVNIQSSIGVVHGYWQYALFAWKYFLPHSHRPLMQAGTLLWREEVDAVLCSEITEVSLRSGFVSQTNIMRTFCALPYSHFFPTITTPWSIEGNAIVSRYPIVEARTHELPGTGLRRIMAEAQLETPDGPVHVFVTHLALGAHERQQQICAIADIISNTQGQCILGGDFNESDDAALQPIIDIGCEMTRVPTFPSWHPTRALDRVFVRGLKIYDSAALALPLVSDHLPLVVTLNQLP
jgi:endonuclease/exonuclease/phosphatase family metal-dependent hydrolase